jgi:glucokinase
MKVRKCIGIDIGGTKTSIFLGDTSPRIIERRKIDTSAIAEPGKAVTYYVETIHNLLGEHGIEKGDVLGIGISCGGPLDSRSGTILSPPNLPAWRNVEITRLIREATGLEAYLDNDANAGAVAEGLWGAGRGFSSFVFLTFGTGIGAGLVLDGKLYRGANDMAGETGHIRVAEYGPVGYGKPGSLEGFCSGGGIAQLARSEVLARLQRGEDIGAWADKLESLTAEDVGKAAAEGDGTARYVLDVCGRYLGKGIAVLVDILNPERIILGSIFVRCKEFLLPAIEETLFTEAIERSRKVCSIVPAGLGEKIGDFAALAVAIEGAEDEG